METVQGGGGGGGDYRGDNFSGGSFPSTEW